MGRQRHWSGDDDMGVLQVAFPFFHGLGSALKRKDGLLENVLDLAFPLQAAIVSYRSFRPGATFSSHVSFLY